MSARPSTSVALPASCWLVAGIVALVPGASAGPLVTAVAWTLLLVTTVDSAWRLAAMLVPPTSLAVLLAATGLLFEAIASGTVVLTGSVGCFNAPVALAIVGALAAVLRLGSRRGYELSMLLDGIASRRFDAATLASALLVLAGTAIVLFEQARYTVQDADSMWYHLPMAGEYVRTGSLRPVEAIPLLGRGYPGFRQSILAFLSVVTGNEQLALLGALEFPLLAACVYIASRQFGAPRPLAATASVLAATTPVVTGASSTQGNDIALAIGVVAALAFGARWLEAAANGAAAAERRDAAILAGIAIGALTATKYSGPGYAAAILAALAVQSGVRTSIAAGRTAGWFLGTAALLALPWYLRNLLAFGNPLYPAQLAVGGHVLFPGPLGPEFFAPVTLGWHIGPLLDRLDQFVEAHGLFVAPVAAAPLLAAIGAWRRPRRLRASLAIVGVPIAMFVAFLHHPFNEPTFDASYIHRYLIAWFSVSTVTLAGGLGALTRNSRSRDTEIQAGPAIAAAVLLFAAVVSQRPSTKLVWPAQAAAAVAVAWLARPHRLQRAHRIATAVVGWQINGAIPIAALVGATLVLRSERAALQFDPTHGWRDPASERGWGPAAAFVRSGLHGKRIGLHGSIYFFPFSGDPFGNEVFLADDLNLDGPRLTPDEVAEWARKNRLDYVVCCVPRTGRSGSKEFQFGESVAPTLLRDFPGRFRGVFESRGAQVLEVVP